MFINIDHSRRLWNYKLLRRFLRRIKYVRKTVLYIGICVPFSFLHKTDYFLTWICVGESCNVRWRMRDAVKSKLLIKFIFSIRSTIESTLMMAGNKRYQMFLLLKWPELSLPYQWRNRPYSKCAWWKGYIFFGTNDSHIVKFSLKNSVCDICWCSRAGLFFSPISQFIDVNGKTSVSNVLHNNFRLFFFFFLLSWTSFLYLLCDQTFGKKWYTAINS